MLLRPWKSEEANTLDIFTETLLLYILVLIQTTSYDPWKPESLESCAWRGDPEDRACLRKACLLSVFTSASLTEPKTQEIFPLWSPWLTERKQRGGSFLSASGWAWVCVPQASLSVLFGTSQGYCGGEACAWGSFKTELETRCRGTCP